METVEEENEAEGSSSGSATAKSARRPLVRMHPAKIKTRSFCQSKSPYISRTNVGTLLKRLQMSHKGHQLLSIRHIRCCIQVLTL